jgi:hypothetical protein
LHIVSVLYDTENPLRYCIHTCHNLAEELLPRKFLQLIFLEITAILLNDLKGLRRLKVMYASRAISHISWLQIKNVSGNNCPHHQTLMGTKVIPETSVMFNQPTQLIARKDLTVCMYLSALKTKID